MNSKEEILILSIVPFLEVIPMPNIFVIEDAGIELNELNYYPIEMLN
jgi:hypothetical protein